MIGDDEVEIALEAVQVARAAGVGRVIAAGERARGLLDRRVLVGDRDPCGECDACRAGGAAVCPSARQRDAMGDTVVAAARWVVPLGDGLELAAPGAAAVAGDVALAYTLYARLGVGPRDPVVVIGASPIGRFVIEILRAKHIAPVVIAEPAWDAWLARKGVATAHDRASAQAAFAAQSLGTRPWRVVCAAPAKITEAVALAGPRALLGVLAPIAEIPGAAIAKELTVIGVAGAHPDLVVEAAAMCVKGEIELDDGISQDPDGLRSHVRVVR